MALLNCLFAVGAIYSTYMKLPFLADSDDGLCCLCDKAISTKLVPCGHAVMCGDCVGRAKRCPNCCVSSCWFST